MNLPIHHASIYDLSYTNEHGITDLFLYPLAQGIWHFAFTFGDAEWLWGRNTVLRQVGRFKKEFLLESTIISKKMHWKNINQAVVKMLMCTPHSTPSPQGEGKGEGGLWMPVGSCPVAFIHLGPLWWEIPRRQSKSEKPLRNHRCIPSDNPNLAFRFLDPGCPYLLIFNVFDIRGAVAVPLALTEHPEAPLADAVNHRSAVSEELDVSDF